MLAQKFASSMFCGCKSVYWLQVGICGNSGQILEPVGLDFWVNTVVCDIHRLIAHQFRVAQSNFDALEWLYARGLCQMELTMTFADSGVLL